MSRARARVRFTAALALATLGTGCAWSNRDNRPVWNAFEEHLVPEKDAAFVATLPLTVPGGLGAILVDSLIVHPVQVVDDAADDARDLWRSIEWSERYYTELAALPFRTVGTPLVFVGSFLGRSMFDFDARTEPLSALDEAKQRGERREVRRAEVQAWLESIAAGEDVPLPPECSDCRSWSNELQTSFEAALRSANAVGRLELYQAADSHQWPPLKADPMLGLRDPDPVVRYLVLIRWPHRQPIADDLLRDLASDPSEMVRLLARKRLESRD